MDRVPQLPSCYPKGEEMNIHKYQGLITWKEVFWRSEQRGTVTQARGWNRTTPPGTSYCNTDGRD